MNDLKYGQSIRMKEMEFMGKVKFIKFNWSHPGCECINPLAPSNPYMGLTAPLTSRRCNLYTYSTNIRTEYFKHAA
jgi:hypothetical protein